jgi:glycosyltransferase involved in cell wall biosynthesis
MPEPSAVKLLFAGTINAFYDVPLTIRLVARAARRGPVALAIASPQPTAWERELRATGAVRTAVAFADMPAHIAAHHAGLSICRASAGVSLKAAMPTKIAEFLAVGRPVLVNRGLGDMDDLIDRFHCGVVVDDPSDSGLDRALDELAELLADGQTPERCRAAAEASFDLRAAIDQLVGIYREISS